MSSGGIGASVGAQGSSPSDPFREAVEDRARAQGIGGSIGAQASSAQDDLEDLLSRLLPPPEDGSIQGEDAMTQLAMLLVKMAERDREMQEANRRSEEEAQRAADAREIQELRDKADAAFTASLFEGFGTAASGGVSVSGVALSKNFERPAEVTTRGSSDLTSATGKIMGAFSRARADEHEASATQARQSAGRANRSADDAKDAAQYAQDLVRKVLDAYKEIQTRKSEAHSAAIHRA
jgi:hypothetical protein